MERYSVKLTGTTGCLMHQDNLSWSEQIKKWQMNPDNKKFSVAGDDRSPAWTWVGSLYMDAGKVCIPADNLQTLVREGGSRVMTGRGKETLKKRAAAGIVVDQAAWPLMGSKGLIDVAPILALVEAQDMDFSKYEAVARDLGFELFVKRARIGTSKHVRVRPRFDVWSAEGTLTVTDEAISESLLKSILVEAGERSGIGDWRPSSPSRPGPWGKFQFELKRI